MLSNIVRSQKMGLASKLVKKGFLNNKMQAARGFSSVFGGSEGSTVSIGDGTTLISLQSFVIALSGNIVPD